MRLYPAIDLKDGQCVRLIQGDYNQVTVFGQDPVAVAKRWQDEGGSYLHLVDLDGAKAGYSSNDEVIRKIVKTLDIPVQLGGGIRDLKGIEDKLALGVERVILGSAAVKNEQLLKEALLTFGPERIVVGVDAKGGKVAVEGWLEVTTLDALLFCEKLKDLGVKTIVYTDIAKDGMMMGPNSEETQAIIEATGLQVIASGGVCRLENLEGLEKIGVEGAIIGKALYTGAIDLKEAVKQFEKR